MRVYVAVSIDQLRQILTAPIAIDDYLTPAQFEFDAQVDQEQQEHLISLLAAEDSMELNSGKFGLVLAVELSEDQLDQETSIIDFSQVAALLHSDDAENLSWFAPEEITYQIEAWAK